ncbi:D-alanyl-D-alanine carboxypeptidase/D-alanyl-D-alanine-endopeptidase [Parapusillimonas sp. SGNA-6]|nr:D-alanyl-D-alanine carboxypeptidase/D-alanyl-D-alanine-endopeptidase [Parapusillimonas sp. SGNA-6]
MRWWTLRRRSGGLRSRPWPCAALLAGLIACAPAVPAMAQALPPEVANAWRATRLPSSAFSVFVKEINGPTLASVNAEIPRNPASVMKMVTTWSALSGLGPEYKWRTTLLAGPTGQVDAQGNLSGPLYLKAGGDPLLTVEELWGLLRGLRLRGVKNISEVVVDRSLFGRVAIDPAEFDGAGDRPYNASPDAMMVGLGAVRLLFQPDARARKWVPIIDPPVPGLRVNGEIGWSDAVCPGSPSVSTQLVNSGSQLVVNVAGTAAGSCGEFSVYRLALSQPAYFSALFQMLWRELGGTLSKGIGEGKVPAGARPLVWHDSETLADMIRYINKESNNVMARTLLLTLGAEKSGAGATPQSGAGAALSILESQRVDTRGWALDNGAGLSREGRLTAQGLGGMLEAAWRSPLMPEFVSSLAISGVDGTMRRRLRSDEARGMAHLKSGSLRDVRALAGYVLGASGKRYILVGFVNHANSASARSFYDALVSWLAAR